MNTKELYNDVLSSYDEIRKHTIKTPLVRLPWLDTQDRTVWGKLDNNQETGSFKLRGAVNSVLKAPADERIVTASAGNHGLGIASACKKFNRSCRVYVPANASESKVTRLQNMGADVLLHGRDLQEAMDQARKEQGYFISPFSHNDVMAGQGSIALEILEEYKDVFDNILVPLGGGGLIAGVASVFNTISPSTKITALHPAIFRRNNLLLKSGKDMHKPVYPTVADGLAAQHSSFDGTSEFVSSLIDDLELISEEDMYIAIASMLQNESQLIEGAGAIGVADLIKDIDGERYKGNILALICGGNISSSNLMRAMATYSSDTRVARLSGSRSVVLSAEAQRNTDQTEYNPNINNNIIVDDYSTLWEGIIDGLQKDLDKFKEDVQRHIEYVEEENLELNLEALELIDERFTTIDELIQKAKIDGKTSSQKRNLFRLMIQEFANARSMVSWCSSSTDQSKITQFFDPAETTPGSVNYDRYGSVLLREREKSLLEALGHDAETVDLFLTSSGQASFTTVLSYLISEQLPENPEIVAAPYVYFEAQELIENQKSLNYTICQSWDIDNLISKVEEKNAHILLMDTLSNLGDMPVIDFRKFAEAIKNKDWSDKWLIVDGTMTSGGFNPFEIFNEEHHPNVIYYESGSKYLGLGLDIQMAGVVISPKNIASEVARHRRNTGAVMYQRNVLSMPRYDRSQFLSRMNRLTNNAEILHGALSNIDGSGVVFSPAYPTNWEALDWNHGGGVVSVMMNDPSMNTRQSLDYLVDLIVDECKKSNVDITKGVSFGFPTTRVSAAAAMANEMPPFLRFSMGEEDREDILKLTECVASAFERFSITFELSNSSDNDQQVKQPNKLGLG